MIDLTIQKCFDCGTDPTHYYFRDGDVDWKIEDSNFIYCQDCVTEYLATPKITLKNFKRIGDTTEMNASTLTWAKASCWELAELAINAVPRVLLWGPPGTAKTTFGLRNNNKRHSITFSEDFTVQELLGHYVPRGTVFEWHDGPVLKAWREGSALILNELGRASGPVLDIMLGVLDDPQIAELALPNGETIRPTEGFRVVATSNSKPEFMDPALVDRFDAIIHITEPHPALIEHLNSKIAGLGSDIKNTYLNPDSYISPRRALAFIQLIEAKVPPKHAAVLAFGDKAPEFIASSAAAKV